MAEYSREQRNKLSRVIANSKTGNGQLKAIVDNRANKIRYIQKKIDNIVLKEGFPTSIVSQLVNDIEVRTSLQHVASYSPGMFDFYGEKTIAEVLKANNLIIRGHASGRSDDKQNSATKKDLSRLLELLKADAEARRAAAPPAATRRAAAPPPATRRAARRAAATPPAAGPAAAPPSGIIGTENQASWITGIPAWQPRKRDYLEKYCRRGG